MTPKHPVLNMLNG